MSCRKKKENIVRDETSTGSKPRRIDRRLLLQSATVGLAGIGLADVGSADAFATEHTTVRDRLWIFACAANSDFPHLQRRSVMTPAEGAFFLGVPNIIMVQSHESEAPYGRLQPPFAQYMYALRPLQRVVWSVVGSGGFTSPKETAEVLQLARGGGNFAGIMLDDFFHDGKNGKRAQWSLDQLAKTRGELKQIGKHLDIYATFYVRQLGLPLGDYLELIDVITLWSMDAADVRNLETNVKKVAAVAPKARKMLGCYVVDYAKKQGIPLDLMKFQCESGLRLLREGRIEGLIFLGNTAMDLGFESVEWLRQWIQKVGDSEL
jgi:hypothetical protein